MQLRSEREKRGWSRGYVAEQVGVDVGTVGRWERGERLPHAHYRQELCTLFKMNAQELGLLSTEFEKAVTVIDAEVVHPAETQNDVVAVADVSQVEPEPEKVLITVSLPQITRRTMLSKVGFLGLVMFIGSTTASTSSTPLFARRTQKPQVKRLSVFLDPNTENWVNNLAWSPDGRVLAAAGDSNMLPIWDLAEKALVHYYPLLNSWANDVSWSKENLIVAANGDYQAGSLQIWKFFADVPPISLHRAYSLRTVAWSPDESSLVFAGHAPLVEVWNANLTHQLHQYTVNETGIVGINRVKWSPDGRFLACATDAGHVHVWEVASGQTQMIYREHQARVVDLSWSPDGTCIASGSVDYTGRVWDVVSGRTRVVYARHTNEVHGISWSPNGKYVVTGSYDTTAQVWDALTGTPVMTLGARSSGVVTVLWSADGKTIALGCKSQGVEIWQAPV